MTEAVTQDTPAVPDTPDAAQAALQAGFDSVANDTPPVTPEPSAEPAEPVATDESTAEPEPPAPEPITLTKSEWDGVQAKLARIDEFDKKLVESFTKTNGQLGAFNQALRDLKQSHGGKKLTVEQFKELAVDYPDVVKGIVEGINAGIPDPEPEKAPEPAKGPSTDELAEIKEQQRILEIKLALTAVDPEWKKLTDSPAFIAWRDSHPPEVAREIQYGRDPQYLADALKGFKGHLKAEAEKAEALKPKPKDKQRLAAAITPTGAPPATRTTQSARSEAQKGFDLVAEGKA